MNPLLRASALAWIGAACAISPAHGTTAPNVIVLLADDLGTGDLGMNGSAIRTPSIDRLAKEGATLTQFYAGANLCTPSRAAILTGRYPIRMGLANGVIRANSTHGLPASEVTLAELLRERGYATALIGKWHLGHTPEYWPTRHGFDYYYGLPYSNDMQPLALYRGSDKIEEPVEQSTLTQRYTAQIVDFIDRSAGRPFFALLAYAAPHIPLSASPAYAGHSPAGPYGDAVEEIDGSVGAILSALESRGLDASTFVIFTSDNGAWFEGSNGALRGMKGETYDGGYRVPFLARWPGTIPPGVRADGIAMNIDILPTVAARAGAAVEPRERLDGRDLWPQLTGRGGAAHEALYLFLDEDIAAVRTARWKLLVRGFYRRNLVEFDRLAAGVGFDYPQLFDMSDPAPERSSLAAREPEVLREMQQRLEQGRAEFEPLRTRSAAAAAR